MRTSDFAEFDEALLEGSKQRNWLFVGLMVSLAIHGALCGYFYRTSFVSTAVPMEPIAQTPMFKVKSVDMQPLDKASADQSNPAAKPDPTWNLLPGGLGPDTTFFLSGQTWFQVFWTAPRGNPYYILADQYMAARLNILNGASSTPTVDATIAWATTFFNTYTPASSLSSSVKSAALAAATTLGSYNEGAIGPGHCDE